MFYEENVDNVEKVETPIIGVVTGCENLNIRKSPSLDAAILHEVKFNTELMVDFDESTDEWYSVYISAGLKGFCMKKYVTIKS